MSKLEPSAKPGKGASYTFFYSEFDDFEHPDLSLESMLPPELAREVQRQHLSQDPQRAETPPTLFAADEHAKKKRKRSTQRIGRSPLEIRMVVRV